MVAYTNTCTAAMPLALSCILVLQHKNWEVGETNLANSEEREDTLHYDTVYACTYSQKRKVEGTLQILVWHISLLYWNHAFSELRTISVHDTQYT